MGLLPDAWGASNNGNADGAVGIFGNAGRVWATALCMDPPKKVLCHTCPLDGACNKYRSSWCNTALLQLLAAAQIWASVSRQREISSGLREPSLRLLFSSGGYCRAPEVPLIMGMSTGPKVFLAMPGELGSGPAPRPTRKRLCATIARSVGQAINTAAAVVSTLPVFLYVEPRKPSSETWIHLCGTLYLRVELFIYWPLIIGHNKMVVSVWEIMRIWRMRQSFISHISEFL